MGIFLFSSVGFGAAISVDYGIGPLGAALE